MRVLTAFFVLCAIGFVAADDAEERGDASSRASGRLCPSRMRGSFARGTPEDVQVQL